MRFQSILLIFMVFILTVYGAAERKNPNGPPPGFRPKPAPKPSKIQNGNETEKKANLRNENLATKILKKLTPIEATTNLFGKGKGLKDSAEKVQKRIKDMEKVAGLIAEYKKLIKEKAEKSTGENKKLTMVMKAEKSSTTKIEQLSDVEKEQFEMIAAEIANAKAERAKNNQNGNDAEHKSIAELNANLQDYMIHGDIVPTVEKMEEKVNKLRAGGKPKALLGELLGGVGNVIRAKRAGALNFEKHPKEKWDLSKPIAYFIDGNISTSTVNCINTAIEFYYNTTCYDFKKLAAIPNDSTPYVHFTGVVGAGCFTNSIGYEAENPEHIVNLGKGCDTLTSCEHEIGHILGLFHTQSRYDRDDYINLNLTNTNYTDQYAIETPDTNNNYNISYEYGSMMHYGGYNLAINDSIPVIRTKDPLYQNTIGQYRADTGATFADVLMLNRALGCKKCPVGNGTADCKNGGYPKTKLCSQCLCPDGWDGTLCDQRKAASNANANCTGATLTATTKWKLLDASVTAPRKTPAAPIITYASIWESCYWHIKAPSPDMWIDLWIEEVATSNDQTCQRECLEAFTEFKVANFTHTGVRMCCQSQLGSKGYVVMTAKQGFAMISANSKWGKKAFRVWYIAY